MNSKQFNIMDYHNLEPVYTHTLNKTSEVEIYSPYGRMVIINKNYLDVNPINSSNGVHIDEQLQNDEDTLNILAPEQFRHLESKIIDSYREWFYFIK